jgi:predicted RNase H-like nuclease (RuvC/YqgF family)
MTRPEAEHRGERQQIETAIERLLSGTPLRSTGDLTIVQLAIEADVKRWKLTHRHVDLMQVFQARTKALNTSSPILEPWRKRVEQLEKVNRELRDKVEELRATASCYAQVIADLDTALADGSTKERHLHSV